MGNCTKKVVLKNPKGRVIFFGDIHGCLDEWEELLSQLQPSAEDVLIALGDLIGRGPKSKEVLDLAMRLRNLYCVLGNQELRLLTAWKRGTLADEKSYEHMLKESLKKNQLLYQRFLESWPLWIESETFIAVHAGIDPNLPLEHQSPETVTTLKTLPPHQRPWYLEYKGPKTVFFGHWPQREPLVTPHAIGIDTGCVYGGCLTAYVLPERKIVSVKARFTYYRP